jgi:hypothetical protein
LSGTRFSISHVFILFIALVSLAVFVAFQQIAIDRKGFLIFMFSSFFFLAAGTFLIIITFFESYRAEKALCLGVTIVFIVTTLFVANSLAQVPRGGGYSRVVATPKSFTLHGESGESQIIYSADYSVSYLRASVGSLDSIIIRTQTPVTLNATVYFWLMLRPYERYGYALVEPIAFKNESMIEIHPNISKDWGTSHPTNRIRLEGYYLELKTRIRFDKPIEPNVDFTFDTSDYMISIGSFIVDSKFQNGLSIILSGIFIGIMCYIPGNLLFNLLFKKLLEKRALKREMYDSEEREKIIALTIVTLSFLSLPVLLFIFVITVFFDAIYIINFYNTRNFADATMAVFLAIVNVGLFLLLRFLIRWIRK